MGIGSLILVLIVVGVIGAVALFCNKTIVRGYNKIVSLVLSPFSKLKKKLNSATRSWSLLHKPKFFGGVHIMVLFVAALVYVINRCLTQWQADQNLTPLLETLLYHTTFGSFITLLTEGFNFSPAIIVAAGFSSLLAGICMKSARKAHWSMWILYSVVFICASALLCSNLSGIFPAVGQWLNDLWNTLSTDLSHGASDFTQIISFIGNLILFIITAYVGLILMLLIVQEYLHCIVYGTLLLCGLGVISLICQQFWPDFGNSGHWTNILMSVVLIAAIIAADIIRESVDD